MENGDNDNKGRRGSAGADRGKDIRYGGGVRPIAASLSTESSGDTKHARKPKQTKRRVQRVTAADRRTAAANGLYWDESGKLSAIPIGFSVGSDGKLRRQRGADPSNAGSGGSGGGGGGADPTKDIDPEVDLREPIKGRRKKDQTEKLTLVAMLSFSVSMFYSTVALGTGHDHWVLEEGESKAYGEALNNFIDSLPVKSYAIVAEFIEKWLPKAHLAFTATVITWPRIKASIERFENKDYRPNRPSPDRNEPVIEPNPAQTSDFNDWTSLGGNLG